MCGVGSIPSYSNMLFLPPVSYYNLHHLYLSMFSGIYWKRYRAKTNTSRNKLIQTSIFIKLMTIPTFRNLACRTSAGRTLLGHRACWTKGRYFYNKFFIAIKNFTQLSTWCCAISLMRSTTTGLWYQQVVAASGIKFTIIKNSAFDFFSIKLCAPLKYACLTNFVTYLCWISNNSTIFSFSLYPAAACLIARAPGSCGYYLTHAAFTKQFAIIIFPSGFLKILSKFILITRSSCNFSANKFITRPGAGFYRQRGKHPNTRGVAMNATDHPHGGKTHTVAMPVSPWGRNTKLK